MLLRGEKPPIAVGFPELLHLFFIRILCLKDYHIRMTFQNIFLRKFRRCNSMAKMSQQRWQKKYIKLFITPPLCYTMLVLKRGNNHDQKRRSYRISG